MSNAIEELTKLSATYNQFDLAEKLGVNQSYVSMILSGKRNPSTALASRINRLYCGTESNLAKWDDSVNSCSVVVAITCPAMSQVEKEKLAKIIAHYACSYAKHRINIKTGIRSDKPSALP
jgi:predicted transcriptional regulator